MIVGDKLKCKKDFISIITGKPLFIKDEYYVICEYYKSNSLSKEQVKIIREDGNYKTSFTLIEEESSEYVQFAFHYLWDYFYTLIEVRNHKINSILNN